MSSAITSLARPELLAWARCRANLEPLAADRKVQVPEGTVSAWESGDVAPTLAELRRAARVYRRPLAVFYLPAPPKDFETLRDYRRIAGAAQGAWSIALDAEHRRALYQREVLLEVLERDGARPEMAWRLADVPGSNERVAAAGRLLLQGLVSRPLPPRSGTKYEHLNHWTAALEAAGVMVMTTERGGVGVAEMRAFSLYYDSVPVITLNGADGPRGRLFSLMHEYAHLMLRTSGICDTRTDSRASTAARKLEARCNAIAAAMLMPRETLLGVEQVGNHDPRVSWTVGELVEVAYHFGVSVEALLRRLVSIGHASMEEYREFRAQASLPAAPKASGGDFYNTKSRDLGRGYVRAVVTARRRGLLDAYEAATFLGVRLGQVDRLAQASRL